MVLALALWQTVSDTFANKAASGGNVVSENTIAAHIRVKRESYHHAVPNKQHSGSPLLR